MPRIAYSGQKPTAPAMSGITPIQPHTPMTWVSVSPMRIRPAITRRARSRVPSLMVMEVLLFASWSRKVAAFHHGTTAILTGISQTRAVRRSLARRVQPAEVPRRSTKKQQGGWTGQTLFTYSRAQFASIAQAGRYGIGSEPCRGFAFGLGVHRRESSAGRPEVGGLALVEAGGKPHHMADVGIDAQIELEG